MIYSRCEESYYTLIYKRDLPPCRQHVKGWGYGGAYDTATGFAGFHASQNG